MNTLSIPNEDEVVRRWWALPPGTLLPLHNGQHYRLLFAGRPGSSSGPDARDAVLAAVPPSHPKKPAALQRLVGDVEFHVRASDWQRHQHHCDMRYNNVILHAVLLCDDPTPTRCQSGAIVPLCSLYDLPSPDHVPYPQQWPCQHLPSQLHTDPYTPLLKHAGLLRFEEKAHFFVEQLRSLIPCGGFDLYDTCLLLALAEALGYGRDRDFFRAAGAYLLDTSSPVPEPLGRAAQPAPLDAARLRVLSTLVARWRPTGAWPSLRPILTSASPHAATLDSLRDVFSTAGLSLARTDILLCNVLLPFALAVALIENDASLAAYAQALYEKHPGLPSNRITRMMCRQLGLPTEPPGSCQQQGLHYIYQQTCREKRCHLCMMGRRGAL